MDTLPNPTIIERHEPSNRFHVDVQDFGVVMGKPDAQTRGIQSAIDAVAAQGGGKVTIPRGKLVAGALRLRSGVHLDLAADSVLQGSSDPESYEIGVPSRNQALLYGENLVDVTISGKGVLDGMDVLCPDGEEGFRGPHAIFFKNSRNIQIDGITIRGAGNYAIYCQDVEDADFRNLKIIAGHDGIHIQANRNVVIANCDIRTGDDCIAGTDNENVTVTDCYFNSACNAFRLGALKLSVRDCRFQGPGEFPHRISTRKGAPRHSMLAAFVHFSPTDRNPKLPSDQWIVENCVIDQVRAVYQYDHAKGLWQTGQPAERIHFRNIRATNIDQPLRIRGDKNRLLQLTLENVEIALATGKNAQPVIEAESFGTLRLFDVTLVNDGSRPLIVARQGNQLVWENVSGSESPRWDIENVTKVEPVRRHPFHGE